MMIGSRRVGALSDKRPHAPEQVPVRLDKRRRKSRPKAAWFRSSVRAQATVWSSTLAPGALLTHEAMPASRVASLEYIWLWPMTWPLVALSVK